MILILLQVIDKSWGSLRCKITNFIVYLGYLKWKLGDDKESLELVSDFIDMVDWIIDSDLVRCWDKGARK